MEENQKLDDEKKNDYQNSSVPFLEMSNEHISRARGCMMGHIIGDAFGSRYKKEDSETVRRNLDKDYDSKIRLIPILGKGIYSLKKGQITDVSELALTLATSVCQKGTYCTDTVSKNYILWFKSNPINVNNSIKNSFYVSPSFNEEIEKKSYSEILRSNSHYLNTNSADNSSLIRMSPLGIFGSGFSEDMLLNWVQEECKLTHPNVYVIDACKTYANCIRTAIITGSKEQVIKSALNTPKTNLVLEIIKTALKKEEPFVFLYAFFDSNATNENEKNVHSNENELEYECIMADEKTRMNYFGIALHCAIYELHNGYSFERSLERVVMKGGDTNVNACITGALLGSIYGISFIPNEWKNSVMKGIQRTGFPFNMFIMDIADTLLGTTKLTIDSNKEEKESFLTEEQENIVEKKNKQKKFRNK